jgi:hypothetical protein
LSRFFDDHSFVDPCCGSRAQPSQRFKVIGESLNDFSRVVGPFGFDSPFTLAAPHHTHNAQFQKPRWQKQQDPEFKREYSYLATMWRLIALNSEETEFV